MFTIARSGPNRLDIELSGRVDSAAMKLALDDLIDQSKGMQHARLLYRVGELELPTPGAIAVELSRLPQLLRLIGRFDKVAVLAGQRWLRAVSELEGALLPGLEIKAFLPHETTAAEAWLKAG